MMERASETVVIAIPEIAAYFDAAIDGTWPVQYSYQHVLFLRRTNGDKTMSTKQQVLGNWNQLKGMIKQQWGQLTDDELQEVEGNFDELVGLIQQKTGRSRQEIQRMVNKLSEEATGRLTRAADTAREYAGQAGEKLRSATEQARERAMEGYEGAQDMVRRRPTESVAAVFITGVVVGLLIGLMVNPHSDRVGYWR
jgi:uncharacterized protein YjbJ (UPF0337 family)